MRCEKGMRSRMSRRRSTPRETSIGDDVRIDEEHRIRLRELGNTTWISGPLDIDSLGFSTLDGPFVNRCESAATLVTRIPSPVKEQCHA